MDFYCLRVLSLTVQPHVLISRVNEFSTATPSRSSFPTRSLVLINTASSRMTHLKNNRWFQAAKVVYREIVVSGTTEEGGATTDLRAGWIANTLNGQTFSPIALSRCPRGILQVISCRSKNQPRGVGFRQFFASGGNFYCCFCLCDSWFTASSRLYVALVSSKEPIL